MVLAKRAGKSQLSVLKTWNERHESWKFTCFSALERKSLALLHCFPHSETIHTWVPSAVPTDPVRGLQLCLQPYYAPKATSLDRVSKTEGKKGRRVPVEGKKEAYALYMRYTSIMSYAFVAWVARLLALPVSRQCWTMLNVYRKPPFSSVDLIMLRNIDVCTLTRTGMDSHDRIWSMQMRRLDSQRQGCQGAAKVSCLRRLELPRCLSGHTGSGRSSPRGSAKTDVTSEAVNSKCHFKYISKFLLTLFGFWCTSQAALHSDGPVVCCDGDETCLVPLLESLSLLSFSRQIRVCVCVPDSDSAQGSKTARHASVVESLKNPVEIWEGAGTRGTHQTHSKTKIPSTPVTKREDKYDKGPWTNQNLSSLLRGWACKDQNMLQLSDWNGWTNKWLELLDHSLIWFVSQSACQLLDVLNTRWPQSRENTWIFWRVCIGSGSLAGQILAEKMIFR